MATRRSPLARWQAEEVARLLRQAHPGLETELVLVETAGDRQKDRPLAEVGGQGVFVKEVQAAVLDGRADLAVHSAKDLQSVETEGLALAAFPRRADPRDTLVGASLAELAPGATLATGSVRRRAQLAWLRPDLRFTDLRGNIATRLERVPAGGAVVVAQAALDRLGLAVANAEVLDPAVMLPQVGQGAMAVECRADDPATLALLAAVDDAPTALAVRAERAFLAELGSGCTLPVAAYATIHAGGAGGASGAGGEGAGRGTPAAGGSSGSAAGAGRRPDTTRHSGAAGCHVFPADATIELEGLVAAVDVARCVRRRTTGPSAQAESLGAELARALLDTPEGRTLGVPAGERGGPAR